MLKLIPENQVSPDYFLNYFKHVKIMTKMLWKIEIEFITIIVLCSIENLATNLNISRNFSCKKLLSRIGLCDHNVEILYFPELAVLVFVHGESWSWGSSALYDARILATLGRIIVVTFNYRLGVFGEWVGAGEIESS